MSRLFSWSAKKDDASATQEPARIAETLSASRALPKFLSLVGTHQEPVLLDLGPVVGANVSFFGDQLSCKMLIEDLHQDLATYVPAEPPDDLATRLTTRIRDNVKGPVHGILCWDVFDYLDRQTARALGACLAGLLHPKGALHGFFSATSATVDTRTKFIVQSATSLKCRREPSKPFHRHALQTGEISRLFPGLTVVESVLLQTTTRESLFRKG